MLWSIITGSKNLIPLDHLKSGLLFEDFILRYYSTDLGTCRILSCSLLLLSQFAVCLIILTCMDSTNESALPVTLRLFWGVYLGTTSMKGNLIAVTVKKAQMLRPSSAAAWDLSNTCARVGSEGSKWFTQESSLQQDSHSKEGNFTVPQQRLSNE